MDSKSKSKSNLKNSEKYAMDLGIVRISKLDSKGARVGLPKTVSFDPSEGKIEEKLKKVLAFKTLNGTMFQLLRPTITDRSVISPQNFRQKIHQVCEIMSNAIKQGGELFLYKELYEDAINLLETEEEKCELLDQYRHTLLMG